MRRVVVARDDIEQISQHNFMTSRKKKKKGNNNNNNNNMSNNLPDDVVLSCSIYHAEGLDSSNSEITTEERNYRVVFWVEPGKECYTHIETGLPDPVWKQSFRLVIERPADHKFLNVEVFRLNSRADRPGTSTGIVAVGRARIRLPEKDMVKKQGRFGLVKFDGVEVKGEGHIVLSMEFYG